VPPGPLRFAQLFDLTMSTTVKRFWTLAGLVLLAAVPARAAEVVILTATVTDPGDITARARFNTGAPTNGAAGVNVTVSVLGALVTVVGTALCFKVAAAAYAGARADGRSSASFSAPHIGRVIWAALIAGAGILAGFIALIIPGIWLLVSWAVFIPALVFEELGPTRALARSFELVRGRWWATLGALLVVALISGIASGLVSSGVDRLLTTSLGDHVFPAALVDAAGGVLASAVALPVQAVMIALLYFDLRRRRERLDAELVARRLGLDPGTVEVAETPPAAEEPGWAPPEPPPTAEPPSEWLPPRPPGPNETRN
jgi:hypothetical protein